MPSVEKPPNPFIQDALFYEGESPEEMLRRKQEEARAKEVSDAIDEQLRRESRQHPYRYATKILLLGQSESGKSTLIENFRLQYARSTWTQEKSLRKIIIYLNLTRSVATILDTMNQAMEDQRERIQPQLVSLLSPSDHRKPLDDGVQNPDFSEKHRLLRLRLEPLARVQKDLEYLGSILIPDRVGPTLRAAFHSMETKPPKSPCETRSSASTGNAWKTNLSESLDKFPEKEFLEDLQATMKVLYPCKSDIRQLWTDPVVQRILNEKKTKLEHPELYMGDVDRLLAVDYQPSDQDAVKARLNPVGVQEYHFSIPRGDQGNQDLILYEIGGVRTTRHAWCSYFDNVNSIAFLVPVNCFDRTLEEDPRMNHLEDDLLAWKHICNCEVLKSVQLILILTKTGLLKEKLGSGIRFNKYVSSYGSRPNDVPSITSYLQQHFKTIHRNSGRQRPLRCFVESSLDTLVMTKIIMAVNEEILYENLKRENIIEEGTTE